MARRLLLALVAAATTLLVVEGILSLTKGRSLRGGPQASADRIIVQHDDAARLALSASTPGLYRYHPDPLVGMVLKPGEGLPTLGALYDADVDGLRVRPGPPPDPDARRVVILGDSVAFGFGVADDETIAAHLERVLADVRGDDADPVVCITAAAPGWNHGNALRFLDDHWTALRPDVLVYLPIDNDLTDTFTVTEGGHRRAGIDLSQRDPWLRVDNESGYAYLARLGALFADGRRSVDGLPDDLAIGAPALTSDLGQESRARYDRNAGSIVRMARRAEWNGAHFAVLHYREPTHGDGYVWILRERLARQDVAILEIGGFTDPPPTCRLPSNPHPNATGNLALATWLAEALLARGWIDRGDDRPLPAAPAEARGKRAAEHAPERVAEGARAARERARAALERRIDLRTGQGAAQVYGGLNPDGSLSTRLLALLPGGGSHVRVRARGVPEARHLGDVVLEVHVDEGTLGRLSVPVDGSVVSGRFALPERADPSAPFDVKIVARDWTAGVFAGRTQLTSCRLLEIVVE